MEYRSSIQRNSSSVGSIHQPFSSLDKKTCGGYYMVHLPFTEADGDEWGCAVNVNEFTEAYSVSGLFEAFCQPVHTPIPFRESRKEEQCAFCHSSYNPNSLKRRRRHESGECKA